MFNLSDEQFKGIISDLTSWCECHGFAVESVYNTCHGTSLQEQIYYIFGVIKELSENAGKQNANINELHKDFVELRQFVNNYFASLDIQKEVADKIDKMVADGSFATVLAGIIGGFISPVQYGAKGDGVTDDTEALKKLFTVANKNHIDVKFPPNKTYKVTNMEQVIDCNVDFNGSTMLLPERGVVFKTSEGDEIVVSADNVQNDRIINADVQDKYFTIVSDIDMGQRNGTGDTVFATQTMYCNHEGKFVNSKWYQKTKASGNYALKNRMESKPNITVKNVRLAFQNKGAFPIFFKITRNNVNVENVYIEESVQSPTGAELFLVQYTGNVHFKNISPRNVQDNTQVYGYIIGLFGTTDVTVDNLQGVNGWGIVGTHFVTNTVFKNCNVNRIDNHYGWYNRFVVENCFITGNHGYLSFGYGYGDFIVRGCNFEKTANSTDSTINLRDDLGGYFSGQMVIENCIFHSYKTDASARLLYFQSAREIKEQVFKSRFDIRFVNCKGDKYSKLTLVNMPDSVNPLVFVSMVDCWFNSGDYAYIGDFAGKVIGGFRARGCEFVTSKSFPQTFIGCGKHHILDDCSVNLNEAKNFSQCDTLEVKGCTIGYINPPPYNVKATLVFVNNVMYNNTNFSSSAPNQIVNSNTISGAGKGQIPQWNGVMK